MLLLSTDPIGIDYYHVKIDPTSDGLNRSSAQWDPTDASTKLPLKIRTEGFGGGPLARSTYNIPFSIMIPKFETNTRRNNILLKLELLLEEQ